MEIMYVKAKCRMFVVAIEEGTAFVGTRGFISDLAAQRISNDAMEPLEWKRTGTWRTLCDSDGYSCTCIGFEIPKNMFMLGWKVEQALKKYDK